AVGATTGGALRVTGEVVAPDDDPTRGVVGAPTVAVVLTGPEPPVAGQGQVPLLVADARATRCHRAGQRHGDQQSTRPSHPHRAATPRKVWPRNHFAARRRRSCRRGGDI